MSERKEDILVMHSDVNADIMDVAYWFLLKQPMTHKRIQKLCYYAQAWSLTLLNTPIARNAEFQAWVHGPVNVKLWNEFKEYGWNNFTLTKEAKVRIKDELKGKFDKKQLEVLKVVWNTYKGFSANHLESQTHSEMPWIKARQGCGEMQACNNLIREEDMIEYYNSILVSD